MNVMYPIAYRAKIRNRAADDPCTRGRHKLNIGVAQSLWRVVESIHQSIIPTSPYFQETGCICNSRSSQIQKPENVN